MATLVHLDTSNVRGERVAQSLANIRDGLATLKELDGQRAQTIAVSATEFGAAFGIADPSEAQAMSDRWVAIVSGIYTGLDDFLGACIES